MSDEETRIYEYLNKKDIKQIQVKEYLADIFNFQIDHPPRLILEPPKEPRLSSSYKFTRPKLNSGLELDSCKEPEAVSPSIDRTPAFAPK